MPLDSGLVSNQKKKTLPDTDLLLTFKSTEPTLCQLPLLSYIKHDKSNDDML